MCHDEDVSSERTLRSRGESEEGIAMGMRSEACLYISVSDFALLTSRRRRLS